jgi:hypothetical protein
VVRANGDAEIEQAIKVFWDRGGVVVRPVGRLDRDSIEAVLGLLACAREAGVSAVVDLGAILPGDLPSEEVVARLMADGSLSPVSGP